MGMTIEEALAELKTCRIHGEPWDTAFSMAIEALEKQKTGKWIPIAKDCRGYTVCFECSNCHAFTYLGYCDKSCGYEFCPWCGAKMEAENENRD
jgi:hypothetical protein